MQPVTLTDGRLLLRPPLPSDVPAVLAACRDPEIARWTTVPAPYGQADAEDWVLREAPANWADGSHLVWYAVDPAEPERVLASVALHHLDLDSGDAEVGYWTVPEARGRGVATDAVRILARWAFGELGLDRIEWLAAVGNDASRRVAEKVGFRIEGTSRNRLALHERHESAWVAGLLPGEIAGEARPVVATPVESDAPAREPEPTQAKSWPALRDVEITAGSLHLRPWRERDATELVAALDDPAIGLWNPFKRTGTPEEDAAAFIARKNVHDGTHVSFAVVDATTGALLGTTSLHHLERSAASGEIGYWTMPAARDKGVARRALGATSRWAFGALAIERLYLYHAVENSASCRVATAAGYLWEATTRRSYRYGDGLRHDEHLHARLATDPEPS